ncbi:MAG: DMT family transporter, partial [Pseudonocardiaceae bacterium]
LLCLLGARIWPGRVAAVLLAVVSGSSWGMFAVLTKGVVHLLGRGLGPLLASPELYAWAVVALAGTVFQQSSFRAGALTASLPTMTVVEPAVSAVLGVSLLGEVLRTGGAGSLTLVAAVMVMIVATVVLSRSEAVASPQR